MASVSTSSTHHAPRMNMLVSTSSSIFSMSLFMTTAGGWALEGPSGIDRLSTFLRIHAGMSTVCGSNGNNLCY